MWNCGAKAWKDKIMKRNEYNATRDAQRIQRRAQKLDSLTQDQLAYLYHRVRNRYSPPDHSYAFGWQWTELERAHPITAKILRAIMAANERKRQSSIPAIETWSAKAMRLERELQQSIQEYREYRG